MRILEQGHRGVGLHKLSRGLIDNDVREWNRGKVSSIFTSESANKILSVHIYNPNSLSKAIWAPQLGAGLMSNPPVSAIKLNVSPTLGPWTHECETIGKSKMYNSL